MPTAVRVAATAARRRDVVLVPDAEIVGLGELLFDQHLTGTKPAHERVVAVQPVEGVDIGEPGWIDPDHQVVSAVRLLAVDLKLVEQLRDHGLHAINADDLVSSPSRKRAKSLSVDEDVGPHELVDLTAEARLEAGGKDGDEDDQAEADH